MTRGLGALGTLIWDRIWHPAGDGMPVEQLGGAAYSLAALSAACPAGWNIKPIVKVGADLWEGADTWLRSLPNVEPGRGTQRVGQPNNRVELRYHDPANRCEVLTGGVPAWAADELAACTEPLSALYVNFISGMEMDLATARALRDSFGGPIYADLHSLFLGPPGEGPRQPRPLPRWEEWLGCFDAVQMNEGELRLLGGSVERLPELLELGPSIALVTTGDAGASFAARSDLEPTFAGALSLGLGAPHALLDSAVEHGRVATPAGRLSGDPTGCGDVWGATCFASLLGGMPLRRAIERAHLAAAAKIRHPRTADLHVALSSSTASGGVLP